jgi:S1-C subfamily serine protease
MSVLLVLISYLAPLVAEQIQYSLTHGRQRAEYDLAGERLPQSGLAELSRGSQLVSKRIFPSVVIVNVNDDVAAEASGPDAELLRRFGGHPQESLGQGAGVVVSADGMILTNHHVINQANEIRVMLSDGRRLPAKVRGVDPLTDLALIKVEASGLTPITWGDSDRLEIGSLIWAVGNPFGLERSVSFGILSAKDRGGVAGRPHQDFLQTDAAVNPGNSGGPLVNAAGEVVGINTAIVGPTYSGVSFAIPSRIARQVAERLEADGYVQRGWIGAELRQIPERQVTQLGLASTKGAMIASVDGTGPNSPALLAGIEEGDVVLRYNGAEVQSPANLINLVGETRIGETATLEVIRNGQPRTIQVTVGERPPEASR